MTHPHRDSTTPPLDEAPSSPTLALSTPTATLTTGPRPTDQKDPYTNDPNLLPLEASVLNEYARLDANLRRLAGLLDDLASFSSAGPTGEDGTAREGVAGGLRVLERKAATVYTALKSSVYGIVLAQQMMVAGGAGGQEATAGEGGV